jgi:hypothetical protein
MPASTEEFSYYSVTISSEQCKGKQKYVLNGWVHIMQSILVRIKCKIVSWWGSDVGCVRWNGGGVEVWWGWCIHHTIANMCTHTHSAPTEMRPVHLQQQQVQKGGKVCLIMMSQNY